MIAKIASAKLEDGDIRGAIRLLSSTDSVVSPDEDTFNKLVKLHPARTTDRRPPPSTKGQSMQTTSPFVRAAYASFPNGSAGGPDGLRPQHIKDLVAEADSNGPLLDNIREFINIILEGKPLSVCPILFGGSLTALRKVGGGLHLIAVGYYWRRLVGKVACRQVSNDCAALFSPKQLGFGVQGGAEIGVHATRRFVENMTSGQVFVKINFKNAFNNIRRDSMLEAVQNHFPQLLPFV